MSFKKKNFGRLASAEGLTEHSSKILNYSEIYIDMSGHFYIMSDSNHMIGTEINGCKSIQELAGMKNLVGVKCSYRHLHSFVDVEVIGNKYIAGIERTSSVSMFSEVEKKKVYHQYCECCNTIIPASRLFVVKLPLCVRCAELAGY
ncbi:hypothetical protein [Photobacterium sp. Alg240-V54]|uniref:hypothetical protein n=1 Tax=Photobacterium sp. Alg240-V54 TaxID=2305995 RepID=UPI0013D7C770|nr:hypothetical protein [Photobacterium sp. Alg240-V54]